MLLVPGKNQVGNVLHVILGPESELCMDMHGACVCDITELLKVMDTTMPVFIAVTRSRSELATVAGLAALGVPVAYANQTGKAPTSATPPSSVQPAKRTGVCAYCSQETELVAGARMKICSSCLEIELGLKKQRNGKNKV